MHTCMSAPVSSLSLSSCLNSTVTALSQSRPASSTSVVLLMKKEPKKSVARIPEGRPAIVKSAVAQFSPWTDFLWFVFKWSSLTCAGSNPHDSIKAHEFLNVSSQVVQESLLVRLSLRQRKDTRCYAQMSQFTRWQMFQGGI